MTDVIRTADEKCIHAPITVGQKPFNHRVEMESFTIQVYAPTRHEFQKQVGIHGDHMRRFYVTQSAACAAEALQKFLCKREGIEIPEEES